MSTIDTAALEAFVQVVQSGSFTRAAERLGSQKSVLSRQLAALERQLGVRLLERSTRAMHLTEIGREVHARAVGILAALEDTRQLALQQQGAPRGRLRLTCGSEFGQLVVSGWISAYLAAFPGTEVEAHFSGRVVDLVHEGYDLAIRLGELPDSRLSARPLGELGYGLYAAPSLVAERGLPAHPSELSGWPLLWFNAGSTRRTPWTLRRGGETVAIAGPSRLRADHSFAVRDAAVAGLGVARLPCRIARPALRDGTLQPLFADWTLPSVPVHAVFASSRYLVPKVRAFVDLALAQGLE